MDVTDLIDYNVKLLNPAHLDASFFCLSKHDPTAGFVFDASKVAGQTYPEQASSPTGKRVSNRSHKHKTEHRRGRKLRALPILGLALCL